MTTRTFCILFSPPDIVYGGGKLFIDKYLARIYPPPRPNYFIRIPDVRGPCREATPPSDRFGTNNNHRIMRI